MLTIGLTGGIGSGKSTVSTLFAELGVPVIDADVAAREVVEPGEPALSEIAARFGEEILNPDGTLNRSKLREAVFADPTARKELEAILHPRIRSRMAEQLSALEAPYTILSIPLLVESGGAYNLDRVLVIDLPEDEQLNRVCQRDGIGREQAAAILQAQCSRSERLAIADDVIENSGDLAALKAQVLALHRKYSGIDTNHE